MQDRERKVDYAISHIYQVVYSLLEDDILVDGKIQHYVEKIRERLLEPKEQQQ